MIDPSSVLARFGVPETLQRMGLGTESMEIDRTALRGYVVEPGDPSYEKDRKIWNGSVDKHPAVIFRCLGVSDVIAGVKFGRAPAACRSPSAAVGTHSPDCPWLTRPW